MEDSTSNTLQEIEKLKYKISSYRDTLLTLKMGTSVEDYRIMKNEFDVLKTQISYLEDLTLTMGENQQTQNEVYEEQIKQFSLQLSVLKQTIKEMSQEILSISDKISISKNEEVSEDEPDVQPTENQDNQSPTISNQPSYKQLRNLTGQVLQPQNYQENIASFEQAEFIGNLKDQRYFNQRYFQSINTHPNQISNGLFKNRLGKTPLRFKKAEEVQDSPENNPEKIVIAPSANRVPESVNTAFLNPIDPPNKSVDAANSNETSDPDSVVEEPVQRHPNNQTESLDVEGKRQKNSFFDFFRKWNE